MRRVAPSLSRSPEPCPQSTVSDSTDNLPADSTDDPPVTEGAESNEATEPVAEGETVERIAALVGLLEDIYEDRGLLADVPTELRERFLTAAGRVSRPDKGARKKLARARIRKAKLKKREQDEAVLDKTGIREMRTNPIFLTPRRNALGRNVVPALEDGSAVADAAAPEATVDTGAEQTASAGAETTPPQSEPIGTVHDARVCYVCQAEYKDIHYFYDHLCVRCGDFNFVKRTQVGDLNGRVALVTGARVKIGYQAAILLLRSGCRVVATTRFPRDAARRYAAEEDFAEWGHRLHVHGIDLRHTPSVESLCKHLLSTLERLDFIINNACQTVRRPPGFYDHLMNAELAVDGTLSSRERSLLGTNTAGTSLPLVQDSGAGAVGDVVSAELSQFEFLPEDRERGEHLFPKGELDADEQQVDLRTVNSWRLKMAEVSAVELLEVHLINAVAPFILNARLKPLMMAVPTADKHIVNVSAMEGQFYRAFKTERHPHTNMAKASLNMMTRTAALDYIEDGIHMNSVDTGWVTDEDPVNLAESKREMHRFHPPLDIVDGAARIVDPIFSGLNTGEHTWGQFLKDYKITDW